MMLHSKLRWIAPALVLAGLSLNLYAVDGVILIDQNRALAGGVTPGDAPGFPITISQPGSYRLSGDLTVPNAGTDGFVVTADRVTIDLNGFSIIGPTVCSSFPCSPAGSGTGVNGSSSGTITVRNGTIKGMGQFGIYAPNGHPFIEGVHLDGNGASGLNMNLGKVIDSSASGNGGDGMIVQLGMVHNNITIGNRLNGIEVSCPSSVVGNLSHGNGSANITTFLFVTGCTFANNSPTP